VHVDTDEISAARLAPTGDTLPLQSPCKRRIDRLEFRHQQLAVRRHEAFDSGVIAQEAHVPQLIEFVRSYASLRTARDKPGDIRLGGGKQTKAGARKCHLGS